jgi:predicted TIM-barrel fold metal-dependent hydrolase
MIIDCHMHYVPEMFSVDRMLASMEAHGIGKTALIAAPIGPFDMGRLQDAANSLLQFSMLRLPPVGRFSYDALLTDKKGYFHILWEKYRIYSKPDNDAVAAIVEEHPDKFMGWIFINPAVDDDPLSEIEKWSSNPGMIGVKTHPYWHRYSIGQLDPAAQWCQEHGYPLIIHLGSMRGSGDYRRLAEKYPGLKIVYAHVGIPYFRQLWAYIKDKENLYVDLSSSLWINQKLVRMAVDFLGPEKCLYGTDGPYGKQPLGEDYDYGHVKGWIEGLPLSDTEREMIFSGNFESIRKR